MEPLPIILGAIAFAAALTTVGKVGEPVFEVIRGFDDTLQKLLRWLMVVAPVGVFGLVAGRFAEAGDLGQALSSLGLYMATVLIGLAIHMVVTLPMLLWWLARRSPLAYARQMLAAGVTAFATASSLATLPLTLEGAKAGGVSERARKFVIPVGATINMDGTALYEAVVALFVAQAYGVELSALDHVFVVITATLAAIGAAGIPEAGLVTLVLVLSAVGLPREGIGLVVAVDWLLDRFRTAVNVWGDACGAAVVDNHLPDGGD